MNTYLEESKRLLREVREVKRKLEYYYNSQPNAYQKIAQLANEAKLLLLESQVYATIAQLEENNSTIRK